MSSSSSEQDKVILVVGSLGLDRLLSVSSYPEPDSKVRTTAYHEFGGGNSGNTASAMAKLSSSSFFCKTAGQTFKIKLLSKIGNDAIGKQLQEELERAGVDCSSPLFLRKANTTTSFVTILVDETEHTRTCLHTPGTSGELTLQDVTHHVENNNKMDEIFENVIHLHSDSRHTEAALALAIQARKRGIPISVDVEKDRHSQAQNQLLEYATTLFTNSHQIQDYLASLSLEMELETGRKLQNSKPVLHTETEELSSSSSLLLEQQNDSTRMQDVLLNAIQPSFHFARWHGQTEKEIVITKGKMGSLHVQCQSYHHEDREEPSRKKKKNVSRSPNKNKSKQPFQIHQEITEQQPLDQGHDSSHVVVSNASYTIHVAGVLANAHIVDTTGAGDAFIGAYILTQYMDRNQQYNTSDDDCDDREDVDPIQLGLEFASWVAGKKLSGPGGRSAVPTGRDVKDELGKDLESVQKSLKTVLSPFGSLP